jgi:hypothetical protein
MVAGLTLVSGYFILRYGEDSGLWKVKKRIPKPETTEQEDGHSK